MGYVGSSVKRVEDPRFIQGKGSYVGNLSLPGMVYLAVKRSPYGHAKIKKINTKANNLSGDFTRKIDGQLYMTRDVTDENQDRLTVSTITTDSSSKTTSEGNSISGQSTDEVMTTSEETTESRSTLHDETTTSTSVITTISTQKGTTDSLIGAS